MSTTVSSHMTSTVLVQTPNGDSNVTLTISVDTQEDLDGVMEIIDITFIEFLDIKISHIRPDDISPVSVFLDAPNLRRLSVVAPHEESRGFSIRVRTQRDFTVSHSNVAVVVLAPEEPSEEVTLTQIPIG